MSFYESPVFVDALLVGIYVLLAVTLGLSVWSMLRSLRLRERKTTEQGIPAKHIAWGVFALLVGTLALTCLLADTTPLYINGNAFTNRFWLRVSDMLINSSIILIVVATLGVVVSAMGMGRHWNDKKRLTKQTNNRV